MSHGRTLSIFGLLLSVVVVPRVTRAQDAPRLGLTMGYPTAVGVIWNITDRVAVRPEMTIGGGSTDSSGRDVIGGTQTALTTDTFSIGVGLSGLFYIKRWDALRAYVTPRFAYAHSSNSSGSPSTIIASSSEGMSRTYTTSGSFGAEYAIGRRFGVFGEIGLAYASSTTSSTTTVVSTLTFVGIPLPPTISTSSSEVHLKSWGVRSAVGVNVYF
jgi:hypothetical protein